MSVEDYLASDIQCSLFTDFRGTCIDDLQAFLVIIFAIWSVVWGIPAIVRRTKYCLALNRRSCHWKNIDDVEKGQSQYRDEVNEEPGTSQHLSSYTISWTSLSIVRHPNKLRKPRSPRTQVAINQPLAPGSSAKLSRIRGEEYLSVKTRLAHFRFPLPESPPTPQTFTKTVLLPPPTSETHSTMATMKSSPSLAALATAVLVASSYDSDTTVEDDWTLGHNTIPPVLYSPAIPPTLFSCSTGGMGLLDE
ncbi:hypothetical protein BXZ70DRAFT_624301 [Cristinia sonorae]|uniref:Transmembrane protein n=1 Tax=Cristinia sonorae TaxID=1940300 RepID=A0A8K0UW73_9AGAR|nr:hypothetical protein BXZ70DRAFT_624301 [Cristinia sonorae]